MTRFVFRGMFAAVCGAALYAQAPANPPSPPGLEASWEMAPVLEEISAHANRLLPALDRVDVQAWVSKGASDTYAAQLDSSKQQARALAVEAKALAANPEKLAASLTVLFRIQGLDTMLESIEEGARRYQSPAEAQALSSLEAEVGANRNRLQNYIVNLAAEREQDLKVMDEEAQRCRAMLTQTTPKGKKK